jgi:hypothetical protein
VSTAERGRPAPTPRFAVPAGGVVSLVIDLALPVALYYGLRAAEVGQTTALCISGVPPAIRVGWVFWRTRRIDAIGALVLLGLALGVLSAAIGGDPRTLLLRNALFGLPFAAWMLLSLRGRPLTYDVAVSLLPTRRDNFERAWTGEPWFRRVWRRVTVLWTAGILLNVGLSLIMVFTLPVDAVPGIETAVWFGIFVVLVVVSQVALHRSGAMRAVFAPQPA